jgi:hypothetical protein
VDLEKYDFLVLLHQFCLSILGLLLLDFLEQGLEFRVEFELGLGLRLGLRLELMLGLGSELKLRLRFWLE